MRKSCRLCPPGAFAGERQHEQFCDIGPARGRAESAQTGIQSGAPAVCAGCQRHGRCHVRAEADRNWKPFWTPCAGRRFLRYDIDRNNIYQFRRDEQALRNFILKTQIINTAFCRSRCGAWDIPCRRMLSEERQVFNAVGRKSRRPAAGISGGRVPGENLQTRETLEEQMSGDAGGAQLASRRCRAAFPAEPLSPSQDRTGRNARAGEISRVGRSDEFCRSAAPVRAKRLRSA